MKIAIITGGTSAERDVSIRSAKNISEVIDFAETQTFIFPEEEIGFLNSFASFDVVIPAIHGVGGEDGVLQKRLQELGVPYIFSHAHAHDIAIDKDRCKHIARELGVVSSKNINSFPLFAKPRFGGSSVASGLCICEEDLEKLKRLNPDTEFICEEPILGREFTVGVIEHDGQTIAPPVIEIIPKGKFFDFANKYDPENLAIEVCPAQVPNALANELQRQALIVHKGINARHISRSDFIVTPDKGIYFLEINTIPGMTDTSLIPKMLATKGLNLKDLLKEWAENSLLGA